MEPVRFIRPREISSKKPVRIVLVGGFLGAGKTTALMTLARRFQNQGLSVAVITNDQAPNLVDTAVVRAGSLPTAEVAGGCFCCRFTDLLDAVESVLPQQPDVLLCEPVGSCTDMVATVLHPLRRFYPALFSFTPFTVLVDPTRVRQILLKEQGEPFLEEVAYIFEKQLEEADLIALTKTDQLEESEAVRLVSALYARFGKPVLRISSEDGDGLDTWESQLLGAPSQSPQALRELNYDTYAKGEAVLGWLNATATVHSTEDFDTRSFLLSLIEGIQEGCATAHQEIAHLKLALAEGDSVSHAHVTRSDEPASVSLASTTAARLTRLTVNARIQADPGKLGGLIVSTLQQTAARFPVVIEIDTLQSFSPAYPRPPYRMTDSGEKQDSSDV
jgi:G3E family GTPase